MSNAFPAKFAGRCGYGDTINEGDTVRYDNDGELIHTACEDNPPADPDKPKRNERNCPNCFTIHAGECL